MTKNVNLERLRRSDERVNIALVRAASALSIDEQCGAYEEISAHMLKCIECIRDMYEMSESKKLDGLRKSVKAYEKYRFDIDDIVAQNFTYDDNMDLQDVKNILEALKRGD